MHKNAVIALIAVILCLEVFSLAVSAAVPDVGASSCVTYSQARASSPSLASKTDSELRSLGFCAGSGSSSTQPASQPAATANEPEESAPAVSSGQGLAGMTLEQMYDAETRSGDETTAELNRISEEFPEDPDFTGRLWAVYLAKSDENLANFQKFIGPELDDLTRRANDCNSQCLKTTAGLDEWDICSGSCNQRYSKEYLAAIRKDVEFSIQKDKETMDEINQMVAEKRGHETFKSEAEDAITEAEGVKFRQEAEEALAEAEQRRVKEEIKAAIADAEHERTKQNIEAAIAEAEMNQAAGLLAKMSGSVGITKQGKAAEWAKNDEVISIGDTITTGKGGSVRTKLAEGSEVYVGSSSEVKYNNPFEAGISLVKGKIKALIRMQYNQKFRVRTPTAVVSVRGTEFVVEYNNTDGNTLVYLYNGSIDVTTSSGREVSLNAGETVVIGKDGEAVQGTLDSQEWFLLEKDFLAADEYPLGMVFAWITGGIMAMFAVISAVLVRKEKSGHAHKKSTKNLSWFCVLLGLIGIVASLLPIIGGPVSIMGATLARIQRMRKKSLLASIGLVLNTMGMVFSFLIWIFVYF